VPFDTLIRGGTVLDPQTGTMTVSDLGITGGRVVALGNELPASDVGEMIDATGRYVVPGLVDLHAHVNLWSHSTSIDADALAPSTGVTTWIDAGSAYPTGIEALREYVMAASNVRILSLLRIGRGGIELHPPMGLVAADADLLAAVAKRHRDVVVGVKVSMGRCDMGPLRIALRAAELAALPLMVHIAQAPPDIDAILGELRPGDIVTHSFTGQTMRIVNEHGALRASAFRARDRGVVFDVGHGAGSFSWATAERLVEAGFWPDTISTDSWRVSIDGPMFDLPTCLSKFLHLGLELPAAIRAVTSRAAEVVGQTGQFGTLAIGAQADVAILRVESGRFPLYDTDQAVRIADRLIRVDLTLVGGRPLPPRVPPPMPTWLEAALSMGGLDPNPQGGLRPEVPAFQAELRRRGHTPAQMDAHRRPGG